MDVVVASMGYYQVPMTSYDLASGQKQGQRIPGHLFATAGLSDQDCQHE